MGWLKRSDASRAASAGPTVDLRIGLLAVSDDEPSLLVWRNVLDAEGVPYDVLFAGQQLLTKERLQHSPEHGRYQALIFTTDTLLRQESDGYLSALGPGEWAVIDDYQRDFGVRRLGAYATPSPAHGLETPTSGGEVGGTRATLTPEGRVLFPELRGDIPLSPGTYGLTTHTIAGVNSTVLVVGEQGSPIVCAITYDDGREHMVMTIASGPHSQHMHLLGHGILNWLTHGRHLGARHFYLSVHVDDVLLSANRTTDDGQLEVIRMQPADVRDAVAWSARTGIRLDLTFNGWGAVSTSMAGRPDQLAEALFESAGSFGWINHTFGHLDLDHSDSAEILTEISDNITWAEEHQIAVAPGALVTGAHSGLSNPALGPALDASGVRWVASDASRRNPSAMQALGQAHAVPRHPVNIPLWVSTRQQLADAKSIATTDSQSIYGTEAAMMLSHIFSNDPRPHFIHQNALTGDHLLLDLLDMVLAAYNELISAPLAQPTLAEAGTELRRRERWRDIIASDKMTATSNHDKIEIINLSDESIDVPVTGYRSGAIESADWITLPAGGHLKF